MVGIFEKFILPVVYFSLTSTGGVWILNEVALLAPNLGSFWDM